MATFDQLPAEQRAIIELVLKQGKSYEALGQMLGLPPERVRELARQSLVTLSPVSAEAVEETSRAQIADYLLQQQSGAESTATRGLLRRSEGARAWSRSVLDSLEQFYDPANLPTIPSGDGAGPPPQPRPSWRSELREKLPAAKEAPAGAPGDRQEPSPRALAVARRRWLAAAGALVLAALLAILVWPIGLVAGDGDDDGKAEKSKARKPARRVVGQLVLQPVEKGKGTGVAVIASGKPRQLIVQARLPATPRGVAYEVWLYNSDRSARSLGAQVTDPKGTFQGAGPLPADVTRYAFIDISREKVDPDARHSGVSVLRGRIDQFQPPAPAQGGQGAAPGAQPQP